MQTMNSLHQLEPCRLCPTRMAVPGDVLCTMCGATLADSIPEGLD